MSAIAADDAKYMPKELLPLLYNARALNRKNDLAGLAKLHIATVNHAGDASASTIYYGDDSLELIADESLTDDNQKFWVILDLWAVQHGAQYVLDDESPQSLRPIGINQYFKQLLKVQPKLLGRIEDELKSVEEWTRELQHRVEQGDLFGEGAVQELDVRVQGVRCALEEVKAGEVK